MTKQLSCGIRTIMGMEARDAVKGEGPTIPGDLDPENPRQSCGEGPAHACLPAFTLSLLNYSSCRSRKHSSGEHITVSLHCEQLSMPPKAPAGSGARAREQWLCSLSPTRC